MWQIILSSLIATSLMTLFSYIVSNLRGAQFREPQLLNELIKRSPLLPLEPGQRNVAGWLIHYSIGFLFVLIFHFIWELTNFEPSLMNGAILGFIFGFIGITGWKIMFRLNPDPPEIEFRNFYIQLVIAHVIFGIGAVLLYLF